MPVSSIISWRYTRRTDGKQGEVHSMPLLWSFSQSVFRRKVLLILWLRHDWVGFVAWYSPLSSNSVMGSHQRNSILLRMLLHSYTKQDWRSLLFFILLWWPLCLCSHQHYYIVWPAIAHPNVISLFSSHLGGCWILETIYEFEMDVVSSCTPILNLLRKILKGI